jgi:ABC-type multidrug transport system fused ATPase/permease subunit
MFKIILYFKSVWEILDIKYKKKSIVLLFLIFLGAIVEIFSIGIIIPVFSVFIDGANYSFPFLNFQIINNVISENSKTTLLVFIVIMLSLIYLIKATFLTYLYRYQSKFCFKVQENLSNNLFKKYLYSNLIVNHKKKTSELIRNLTTEMDQLVTSVLLPTLNFIVEFVIFISIISILIFYEPAGTLIVFLFAFFIISFFYLFTKKKINKLSEERK